jgi:hypothetical protein
MVKRSKWIKSSSKCILKWRRIHKIAFIFIYLQRAWIFNEGQIRQLCISKDIWERIIKAKKKTVWCYKRKTCESFWTRLCMQSSPKSNLIHSRSLITTIRIFGRNLSLHIVFNWESKWKSCSSKMLWNSQSKSSFKNSGKDCLKCKY